VAYVEAEDLEDAYHLTNTIDRPWWENPGVTPAFEGSGTRSTSAGDMIAVDDDPTLAHETYEVSGLGWTAMEDLDTAEAA
jgi:hypothetical protein